jgi:hypothetical protein
MKLTEFKSQANFQLHSGANPVGIRYWDQSRVQQQLAHNNSAIRTNNTTNINGISNSNSITTSNGRSHKKPELILASSALSSHDSYGQTFSGIRIRMNFGRWSRLKLWTNLFNFASQKSYCSTARIGFY